MTSRTVGGEVSLSRVLYVQEISTVGKSLDLKKKNRK